VADHPTTFSAPVAVQGIKIILTHLCLPLQRCWHLQNIGLRSIVHWHLQGVVNTFSKASGQSRWHLQNRSLYQLAIVSNEIVKAGKNQGPVPNFKI
jgi:hypothetical protein